MPKLALLRGIPGSGKSYATLFIPTVQVIDPDNYFSLASSKTFLYQETLQLALETLNNNKNGIWCQCWAKLWGMDFTLRYLTKYYSGSSKLEMCIFQLDVPYLKCYRRFISKQDKLTLKKFQEKYVVNFDEANLPNLPIIKCSNSEDLLIKLKCFFKLY